MARGQSRVIRRGKDNAEGTGMGGEREDYPRPWQQEALGGPAINCVSSEKISGNLKYRRFFVINI